MDGESFSELALQTDFLIACAPVSGALCIEFAIGFVSVYLVCEAVQWALGSSKEGPLVKVL